jgi:hypothetical protein
MNARLAGAGALLLAFSTTLLMLGGHSAIGWLQDLYPHVYLLAAVLALGWSALSVALWRSSSSEGSISSPEMRSGVRVLAIAAGFGVLAGLTAFLQGIQVARLGDVGSGWSWLYLTDARIAVTAAQWLIASCAYVAYRRSTGQSERSPLRWVAACCCFGFACIGVSSVFTVVLVITDNNSIFLAYLTEALAILGWVAILAGLVQIRTELDSDNKRGERLLWLGELAAVAFLLQPVLFVTWIAAQPKSLSGVYQWLNVPYAAGWLLIALMCGVASLWAVQSPQAVSEPEELTAARA